MAYCTSCGTEIASSDRFCHRCGSAVDSEPMDADRVDRRVASKRNPVGIAAGATLIISVFLPWIEIPILGTANLIAVTRFVRGVGGFASSEGALFAFILVAILVLVLGGGVVALLKSKAGGGMAIAGLLVFTVLVVALQSGLEQMAEPFAPGMTVNLFAFVGIGYYVGWVAAIVSVFSRKMARSRS